MLNDETAGIARCLLAEHWAHDAVILDFVGCALEMYTAADGSGVLEGEEIESFAYDVISLRTVGTVRSAKVFDILFRGGVLARPPELLPLSDRERRERGGEFWYAFKKKRMVR